LKHEYDCQLRRSPQVIIDAGANIGLASIYFATRFPEARIIAIEPEEGNLEVLRLNTREYPNVTVFPGALWGRDEQLHVVDNSYGNWGFMTSSVGDPHSKAASIAHETCGITVPSLLKKYGIQRVDIFKIDIEGAEKELFEDCAAWIEQVDALIVELHDRMKPGCAASFEAGTEGFDMKWQQGENEFRARLGGSMVAAANGHADGLA
jgi:FkbM family methyltransferase